MSDQAFVVATLLAAGVFFLAVALVLRWSSYRLSVLRDDETDLREYLADEHPWMPEEVPPAQSRPQGVNGDVRSSAVRGVW